MDSHQEVRDAVCVRLHAADVQLVVAGFEVKLVKGQSDVEPSFCLDDPETVCFIGIHLWVPWRCNDPRLIVKGYDSARSFFCHEKKRGGGKKEMMEL